MTDDTKKIQGDKDEATNQATDRLAKLRREQPVDEKPATEQGRPTPTQDELDRIRKGEKVELQPDGSPEDFRSAPVDHLTESHKRKYGGGPKAPEGEEDPTKALRAAGFKRVDEDDKDKTKAVAEEDDKTAAYKTREAHPDKTAQQQSGQRPKVKDKDR